MVTSDLPPVPAAASDVVDGLILTKLDALLTRDATVAQVDAALARIGGDIVHMSAGSRSVTIGIPRRSGPGDLTAAAATLAAQPGFAAAFPGRASADRLLPPGAAGAEPEGIFQIEHLLPARFPAAWNASARLNGCEANPVAVLVPDQFATTAPSNFSTEVGGALVQGSQYSPGNPHGFRVMTTLAARLDATNPTGAVPFPHCLDITGVEMFGLSEVERLSVIAQNFPEASRFVLNYSQGLQDACADNDDGIETCTPDQFGSLIPSPFERLTLTLHWQTLSRHRWDDAMVVTAAGNEGLAQSSNYFPGLAVAAYSSPLSLARFSAEELLNGVQDPALWGANAEYAAMIPNSAELTDSILAINTDFPLATGYRDYAPAPNVVTVGSTTRNRAFAALSASAFSDRGADVQAVGESVYVLGEGLVSGTSFATPQVAGLAAYLWLLSPELRAQPAPHTAALIRANSVSNGSTDGFVDAYASVLALDGAGPINPTSAPIRRTLLDVDENGGFDGLDLLEFATAYGINGGAPPSGNQDYSRHDLNGDGYTGGIGIARFDLDRIDSTQFGASSHGEATQSVEGIEIALNENALTDLQILCYYAYSPLYQGGADERAEVLGIRNCVNANLAATLGQFTGDSAPLNITLTDDTGSPLTEVELELSATGGSVHPDSGTTDGDGGFEAIASVDSGSSTITIRIVARDTDGTSLAEATVEATLPAGVPTLKVDFSRQMPEEYRVPLTIRAIAQNGEPVPGAYVELAATGGRLDATSGFTGSNGAFTTNARLDVGSPSMTISVRLLEGPGGTLYDGSTVVGERTAVGKLVLTGRRERVAFGARAGDGSIVTDNYLNSCGFGQSSSVCIFWPYGQNGYSAGGAATFTHDVAGDGTDGIRSVRASSEWNGDGSGTSSVLSEVNLRIGVSGTPVPTRVRLECAAGGGGSVQVFRESTFLNFGEYVGLLFGPDFRPNIDSDPTDYPGVPIQYGGGVLELDFLAQPGSNYRFQAFGAATGCFPGYDCSPQSGACSYEITPGAQVE